MRYLTRSSAVGCWALISVLLVSMVGCFTAPARSNVGGTTADTGAIPRHASHDRTTVVRQGETLESLANHFGTTVDALVKLNPSTANRPLQPGEVLKLPTGKMPIRNVERRLRPSSGGDGR